MYDHVTDAVKRPAMISVDSDLVCVRFETMKMYSALGAVRALLDSGRVRPGDTLIDSSSGIYAYALALACHRHGMRCHIVGSTTVDRVLQVQLEILGATVELVRPSTSLRLDQNLRVRRIAELLRENPSYHWMRQYHDSIHYSGYAEVARQIGEELPDGPLSIVGAVGTGASTGAIASWLRASGRDVQLVGVQPFGSVTFGSEHLADAEILIAGIGSSIEFQNVRHELYDRIHWLSFDYAMSGAVGLLRSNAVFAGLSAGAAYLAARWEHRLDGVRRQVFIAADTGHRYVETAFSRHAEAHEVDKLEPLEVESVRELARPWSAMNWAGRPAPQPAGAGRGVR
ncbi:MULTISPECIES: pyridoxal-phosphate dependent enzyme [Actinoalloteichus]|uniref:Cysteine synthase n=1 Tax=Actinoalloteichus fjordicus TaxID=1612552 RepID=A0AAC9LEX2_9PSEU|nr:MULTISPECIES: pyridoxal-phosphate dependent enzyme [Actinoalloteichus]APU14969.1 cysteine synthase [Actinoalloteichus fjordicus]APU21039.1 cysteine synthase [Actinoalloteichus sp. GBA129-24]